MQDGSGQAFLMIGERIFLEKALYFLRFLALPADKVFNRRGFIYLPLSTIC